MLPLETANEPPCEVDSRVMPGSTTGCSVVCGASWEGYAIEEALKLVAPDAAYFWATHQGAELDLLLMCGGRRYGVEVKRQDAPTLTRSMRIALNDLRLDHLTVLYPGARRYELAARVTVLPLRTLADGDPEILGPRHRGDKVRSSGQHHAARGRDPR